MAHLGLISGSFWGHPKLILKPTVGLFVVILGPMLLAALGSPWGSAWAHFEALLARLLRLWGLPRASFERMLR